MLITKWIIIKKPRRRYGKCETRMTSNKPKLNNDEIAIKINMEIPQKIFEETKYIADLKISEDKILKNNKIDCKIINI